MKSIAFTSNAFAKPSEVTRDQRLMQVVLMPVFTGAAYVFALWPLMNMVIGSQSSMSKGHGAPEPGLLIAMFVVGFGVARVIGRINSTERIRSILVFTALITSILVWLRLDPNLNGTELLSHPGTLIHQQSYLILPIALAMVLWGFGSRLGSSLGNMIAQELRMMHFRAWVVLVVSVAIATVWGGDFGHAGLNTAKMAVPLAAIATGGSLTMFEHLQIRARAQRLGAQIPGDSRWLNVFLPTAGLCLLGYAVLTVTIGPQALHWTLGVVNVIWTAFVGAVIWTMYGIGWVFWQLFHGAEHLLLERKASPIKPLLTPEVTPPAMPGDFHAQIPVAPDTTAPDAARWLGATIVFVVCGLFAALLVWNRMVLSNTRITEARSSLFSRRLIVQQFKDLFRRRDQDDDRNMDLSRRPETVREAMKFLEVLAWRKEVGRLPTETPQMFASRLGLAWDSMTPSLATLQNEYEAVRYGDELGDDQRAVESWLRIYEQSSKNAT